MIERIKSQFRGSGLRATALRASVWSFLGFGMSSFLRLASNLVLTRLLAPEIFGLMSLAYVILYGVELLTDVGTQDSVVRSRRGEDESFLQTAWTVQVTRSIMIAAVVCLIAWPVSRLYDQPVLFPLISVLSVATALKGFRSISLSVLSRKMDVKRIAIFNLLSQILALVITALAAWILQSVWALAIGTVAGSLVNVAMSHLWLPKFPHRLRLEREAFHEIFTFGRWILLSTAFTYLGGRGITAIHGTLVPIETLGLLAIAMNLATAPRQLIGRVLGSVAYPAMAQVLRDRPQDLPRVLSKFRLAVAAGFTPCYLLLSFISQPLIDLLYDDRYALAGSFLALLALNAAIGTVPMLYQQVLLARGESSKHAIVMTSTAAAQILAVFVGFRLGGIEGMIVAGGLVGMFTYSVSVAFAIRGGIATLWIDGCVFVAIWASYLYTLSRVAF